MGYLRPDDIDTVNLPTAGYWAKMRTRVKGHDHSLSLTTAIEEVPEGDARRWVIQNEVLAACLITEWNLTDEDDRVLPINRENLGKLDHSDYESLLMEANKRRGARPEVKEIPFVKPSRPRSKASR